MVIIIKAGEDLLKLKPEALEKNTGLLMVN